MDYGFVDFGFGDFIRRIREKAGLTQAEFGKRLGVSTNAVSRWENNHDVPRPKHFEKMLSFIGITTDQWLALPGESSPQQRAIDLLVTQVVERLEGPTAIAKGNIASNERKKFGK